MTMAHIDDQRIVRRGSALAQQLQVIGAILLFAAVISSNPLLSVVSLGAFGLMWYRAMSNPIVTIAVAYLSQQWLAIVMTVIVADFTAVDLSAGPGRLTIGDATIPYRDETSEGIIYSLFCLVVLTYGIRFIVPKIHELNFDVADLNPKKLLILYFCFLATSGLSGPLDAGGLSQPLNVVSWLRFVPIVLLFTRWIILRDGSLLLFVCALEVVNGFLGYFSGFRNVFFILGVVMLAEQRLLGRRAIRTFAVAAVIVLLLGTVWTVIKPAYRSALSMGEVSQSVTLSLEGRIEALQELTSNIDLSQLADGFGGLLSRISAVEYLSDSVHNVPDLIPHQDGALWLAAVENLKPRLLFPSKDALESDSVRTGRFIGRYVASDAEATSISLGYVADSYIDFGWSGAIIVCGILGLFYGLLARLIVKWHREQDVSVPLAVIAILFFQIQQFELSNVKLLGGIIWTWIICSGFIYIWPKLRRFCSR